MARWRSDGLRRSHFEDHGREMGTRPIQEYDASVDATLDGGTYFTYWDHTSAEDRIGCFDWTSGRFVAMNQDDEVVSHFATTERYVRRLPYSNYDR